MKYELVFVVESELAPRLLLEEVVSNLESLPSGSRTQVESGVVLQDGKEVAVYDSEEEL